MRFWPVRGFQASLRLRSFGEVLDLHKGVGPGFDHLRILLSLVIFTVHASAIVHGRTAEAVVIVADKAVPPAAWAWLSWREPLYLQFVPMFFALSGFLVAGSAARLRSVRTFLTFRVLRILPALLVETLLSALIIGPIVTDLAWREYFSSPILYRYIGNIVGVIYFYLPGVFARNPIPNIVNNSLWTLPSEFYCYLFVCIAMISGVFLIRNRLLGVFILLTIAVYIYGSYKHFGQTEGNFRIPLLLHSFLCGCLIFQYRNLLSFNIVTCLVAALIAYLFVYSRYLQILSTIPIAYFTICLGMVAWPRLPLIQNGDYSYGIYLYGFPICQASVALDPGLITQPALYRVVSLLATVACAVASWHMLEKPFLALKKYVLGARSTIAVHLDTPILSKD